MASLTISGSRPTSLASWPPAALSFFSVCNSSRGSTLGSRGKLRVTRGHPDPFASPRTDYWFFFFSCLAAFFSFMVLAGFFFSLFFESMPLLMSCSAMWKEGGNGNTDPGARGNTKAPRDAIGV